MEGKLTKGWVLSVGELEATKAVEVLCGRAAIQECG